MAIVDDDASANRALGRVLRGAGFAPRSFDSAESFLADPLRSSFACLLMDIQLTGLSGFDLQRRLLTEGSRIPVIFITAHDDPGYRTEAAQLGCAGFFRKTELGIVVVDALRRAVAAR